MPVDPPLLYIGHDHTMAIVSTAPLTVDRGRADTHRWGRVVEMTPPKPAATGLTASSIPPWAIVLLVVSCVLVLFDLRLCPLPILAAIVALGVSVYRAEQQRRPGVIVAPSIEREADQHVLLVSHEERTTLSAAIEQGKRISQTLPALAGMIDEAAAERAVASALFDLAEVLERRQELRASADDLRRQHHHGLPPDSPTVAKLLAQRERVAQVAAEVDADVARRLAGLEATARAGENFIREREIHQVTSAVDHTLSSLAPPDLPRQPDSGAELAEQVDAVLAAYRELNDRYGD